MQQAKHSVAVLHRLADDADGKQVVDLVQGNLLLGELLLDGVEALDAPLHATGDLVLGQLVFQRLDDSLEEDLALAAQRVHLGGELLVGEGVGVAEG